MLINGVDIKHRGGDCLKQSLAYLLNMPLDKIPNFHKLPLSSWKIALVTWINSKGLSFFESKAHKDGLHIAIFRLTNKETNERFPLHAVVCNKENVVFDILGDKSSIFNYQLVKCFIFDKT